MLTINDLLKLDFFLNSWLTIRKGNTLIYDTEINGGNIPPDVYTMTVKSIETIGDGYKAVEIEVY